MDIYTPPLVLVVDDDLDTRSVYAAYFASRGCRAASAADGVEAVNRSRRLEPDIVLVDLLMPEMDGWQAIRELRALPATQDAFIVAVSVLDAASQRAGALKAGADAFVTKPATPAELYADVARAAAATGRTLP